MEKGIYPRARGTAGKLHRGLSALCLAVFCLACGAIAVVSAVFLVRSTVPAAWCLVYLVLPALIALGAIRFWPKEGFGPVGFALALFGAALLLRGIVAAVVRTPPESDFGMLYEAARALAGGDNILNATPYFQRWPYQSGFVAVLAFCIRVFGADAGFFPWCNVVLSALLGVLVYVLARRFAPERGAQLAGLACLLYPGTYVLLPVLTNQPLAECLLLCALCLYTAPSKSRSKGLLCAAGGGLLLSLSNAVRPMGIVVVLAALAWAVVEGLGRLSRRESLGDMLLPCAVFVGAYFLCSRGLDAWTRLSGLNRLGLSNQVPEWKFILGLNEATSGRYSGEDAAVVFSSGGDVRAAARALLQERLNISPLWLLKLMAHKVYLMWGSFEDTSWALTPAAMALLEDKGLGTLVWKTAERLCRLGSGGYAVIALLAGGGALAHGRRRGKLSRAYGVVLLAALAYFSVHLFIEIQVRYRSTMTLLLLLLLAPGAEALARRMGRRSNDSAR